MFFRAGVPFRAGAASVLIRKPEGRRGSFPPSTGLIISIKVLPAQKHPVIYAISGHFYAICKKGAAKRGDQSQIRHGPGTRPAQFWHSRTAAAKGKKGAGKDGKAGKETPEGSGTQSAKRE
ncbi:MAG: hypothetical protein CW338_08925 [Clostridiales bacterium]|nr:hypothetical protein [Clostridiales bacterium]